MLFFVQLRHTYTELHIRSVVEIGTIFSKKLDCNTTSYLETALFKYINSNNKINLILPRSIFEQQSNYLLRSILKHFDIFRLGC